MVIDAELEIRMVEILISKDVSDALDRFNVVLAQISDLPPNYFTEVAATFADMISQGSVTLVVARKMGKRLTEFVDGLSDDNLVIETLQEMLYRMQPRAIAFEYELAYLRDRLAQRLMKVGKVREAVEMLRAIPVDSHARGYSDEYKLQICARLTECLTELKEFECIENVLNQVSKMLPSCTDEVLKMKFKIAQALLLDSKQKFLEAGQRYIELSIRFRGVSTEAQRTEFLEHALISTILGGASQQRARLLTFFYRDERCRALKAYPVLEKMQESYSECLFSLGGNSQKLDAVLERVVVEHNMIAASKVYSNITLKNLAELLEIETEQAESIAAQMVEEERLDAFIDQIDGLIFFERDNMNTVSPGIRTQNLWTSLNQILENIEADHPKWIAERTENGRVRQNC
nr:cop9 complex subunit [Hymenolepis microstoma]